MEDHPILSSEEDGERVERVDKRRNREALVRAAEEVVARDGAYASLEEVARLAGVGSATLHRHFPSRTALLEAVFAGRVTGLCDRAVELAGAEDAGAALVEWLRGLAVYAATTRGLADALLSGPGGIRPEDSCHGRLGTALDDLLLRARAAGAVRDDVTADDLLGLANAVSLASPCDGDAADRLMLLAVRGLK